MSKYGAKSTIYAGHKYPSKLEAEVAMVLDNLRVPNTKQVPIVLRPKIKAVRATKTRAEKPGLRAVTYVADFVVYPPSELVRSPRFTALIIEAKGVFTSTARLKLRLLAEFCPEYEVSIVRSPDEARVCVGTHGDVAKKDATQRRGVVVEDTGAYHSWYVSKRKGYRAVVGFHVPHAERRVGVRVSNPMPEGRGLPSSPSQDGDRASAATDGAASSRDWTKRLRMLIAALTSAC